MQQPWQQLAGTLQQLVNTQQATANATQGVQQAVANLPPPDEAIQQQVLQALNNIEQQLADMQQQVTNTQQQVTNTQEQVTNMQQQMDKMQQQMSIMQNDIGAMRLEVRASANASVRISNCTTPDSMPLQWLYNNQGNLPNAQPITRQLLLDAQVVDADQLNNMLQHYDLQQQAQGLDANSQRSLLLRHMGATPHQ